MDTRRYIYIYIKYAQGDRLTNILLIGADFFFNSFIYLHSIGNVFFLRFDCERNKKSRYFVVSATAAVTVYPAHIIYIDYERARRLRTLISLNGMFSAESIDKANSQKHCTDFSI